jgi:hypothetical protein
LQTREREADIPSGCAREHAFRTKHFVTTGELAPHRVVQYWRKFDYIGGFATVIAAQNAGHDVDSRLAILEVIFQ